ncbi:hypothetical protein DHEL01_v206882 [Diaporthe helianthi]|uniref:Uncharacterized protein n=1 Tax=Diaporthe helianthi TaxID=158607 RepID=A0A2P5HWU5_DIAHE|nr:hypothetical protein DHEL01_v206882 [Diaporthe helianthi]
MAHLRPPPLLLSKRLTSFLQLNVSAQITTLLLLTPDGKLLAYASQPPIPVATLRTHGTIAASLYKIHSNGADQDTIDAALPPGSRARRASRGSSGSSNSKSDGPLAVTIQLESGTVLVIRRLRCGMLFVCMGPPAGNDAQGSRPATQHQQQQQQQGGQTSQLHQLHHPRQGSQQSLRSPQVADDAPAGGANGHTFASSPPPPAPMTTTTATATAAQPPAAFQPLGSPPETASIRSAATGMSATSTSSTVFGAGTAGVVATRRHAEELARWLDDKLGALDVPEDGLTAVVG